MPHQAAQFKSEKKKTVREKRIPEIIKKTLVK
jgi:hypothetical protein